MHSYTEFCKHYQLDPDSNDARQQYRDYRDNLAAMLAAVRSQDEQRSAN